MEVLKVGIVDDNASPDVTAVLDKGGGTMDRDRCLFLGLCIGLDL